MRRWLFIVLPLICLFPSRGFAKEFIFNPPIDALSAGTQEESISLEVRGFDGAQWSQWQALEREDEQDPALHESNLVIFPEPVSKVEFRGGTQNFSVHPIRVSDAPAKLLFASLTSASTPKILSRSEWGADESLIIDGSGTTDSHELSDTPHPESAPDTPSVREQDCMNAQKNYPQEFKVSRTVSQNPNGDHLRWPESYSPNIRLLVVHHTAIANAGDTRSGIERMRALYHYHAMNRGWGDIGYNYVIDDSGQIYEGRAGGDYVVGGHVYCNNVGTIGISLMGNFDNEEPSLRQTQSLQWLTDYLAEKYSLDVSKKVIFHGKVLSTVVGHRELVSTDCPGFYAFAVLDQIRGNVVAGNLNAAVVYPVRQIAKHTDHTAERREKRLSHLPQQKGGLSVLGGTDFSVRPGEALTLMLSLDVTNDTLPKLPSLRTITRSDPSIGIWQDRDGTMERLRTSLLLPGNLGIGQQLLIKLQVQVPRTQGSYSLGIGTVTLNFEASGRRLRTAAVPATATTSTTPAPTASVRPLRQRLGTALIPTAEAAAPVSSSLIRILLHPKLNAGTTGLAVNLPAGASLNGSPNASTVSLQLQNGNCVALQNGNVIASGIIRLDPGAGVLTITNWTPGVHSFRGVLECRSTEGSLAIINELPLEQYLSGLAEEPDSEPYEKQRAFAVAARTYAAYYLDPAHRKFPGQPYDGSDDPAVFQKYTGVSFENQNPNWMKAVLTTANLVLKKDNQTIRPPYFSSDDGRTRSPAEAGWASFPFAEIFGSKPDPWCNGMPLAGHGVGMSGCGAEGQANQGKTAEEILKYYYPGTSLDLIQ